MLAAGGLLVISSPYTWKQEHTTIDQWVGGYLKDGENYFTIDGLKESLLPDLVLLDLRMPKIDGLEVLRRIKTDDELHRLPVVILTTSEAESDVAKAYDLRANSYLVKPIDFSKFSEGFQ